MMYKDGAAIARRDESLAGGGLFPLESAPRVNGDGQSKEGNLIVSVYLRSGQESSEMEEEAFFLLLNVLLPT